MKKIKLLVQILSVISIAGFAGSMLMLYTSLVPFWKQLPSEDFLNWFSNYSSGITATTGLFVKLSMLIPLTSIFLTWKTHVSRNYWAISYAFILGIMVITFSFFIEANESFVSKTIELKDVKEAINTWANLHAIRIVFSFLSAFFAALGMIKYISSTTSSELNMNDLRTEQ